MHTERVTSESSDEDDHVRDLEQEVAERDAQLASLPAIEEAKGMLMQDFGVSEDEAFELLSRLSQDTNTKLRDLAVTLVSELRGSASKPTARGTLDAITDLRDQLRREH